jgi:hypothetical protein
MHTAICTQHGQAHGTTQVQARTKAHAHLKRIISKERLNAIARQARNAAAVRLAARVKTVIRGRDSGLEASTTLVNPDRRTHHRPQRMTDNSDS